MWSKTIHNKQYNSKTLINTWTIINCHTIGIFQKVNKYKYTVYWHALAETLSLFIEWELTPTTCTVSQIYIKYTQ